MEGDKIHKFAKKLWPINRSITGSGQRKTLRYIRNINKNLKIKKFKTGKKVFDWKIPEEWNIKSAWIKNLKNEKIIDFIKNNLHVVGYSRSVNKKISLTELKKKLFSIKSRPNAIPYVTSYYKKSWGFCIEHKKLKNLKDKYYKIKIDSYFSKGNLSYGEILIPGKSKKEILFTTYICHPSMANNELSGPSLLTYLSKWLKGRKNNYTYRILFLSETIGSIAYINSNLKKLQSNVIAGFVVTCVGDDRSYSYLPSKQGDTLSDKVVLKVLKRNKLRFKKYSWLDRGSDERQFCAPGVNLPVCSIMRTKYGEYSEYHTSDDNLIDVVTPNGLNKSFSLYKKIIYEIEKNEFPKSYFKCEPQLGKRNLYPTTSSYKGLSLKQKLIKDFLSYCDGNLYLYEIAKKCKSSLFEVKKINKILKEKKLVF
jgi:aminopeptidase-like protein